jgi:hypothetical protein
LSIELVEEQIIEEAKELLEILSVMEDGYCEKYVACKRCVFGYITATGIVEAQGVISAFLKVIDIFDLSDKCLLDVGNFAISQEGVIGRELYQRIKEFIEGEGRVTIEEPRFIIQDGENCR